MGFIFQNLIFVDSMIWGILTNRRTCLNGLQKHLMDIKYILLKSHYSSLSQWKSVFAYRDEGSNKWVVVLIFQSLKLCFAIILVKSIYKYSYYSLSGTKHYLKGIIRKETKRHYLLFLLFDKIISLCIECEEVRTWIILASFKKKKKSWFSPWCCEISRFNSSVTEASG